MIYHRLTYGDTQANPHLRGDWWDHQHEACKVVTFQCPFLLLFSLKVGCGKSVWASFENFCSIHACRVQQVVTYYGFTKQMCILNTPKCIVLHFEHTEWWCEFVSKVLCSVRLSVSENKLWLGHLLSGRALFCANDCLSAHYVCGLFHGHLSNDK